MMYVWNIFIFAATGYVVFGLGHSGWWMLLPISLFMSHSSKKDGQDD
jgi:hypothetical protein